MGVIRFGLLLRFAQGAHDTFLHLAGGLARKGNRQNLFGVVAVCQQRQHALGQQPGFTGARRGGDRKRTGRVQRGLPGVEIRWRVGTEGAVGELFQAARAVV